MSEKIIAYLFLVFGNWYIVGGIFLGYFLRVILEGKSISLITGIVIGMIIFETFKYLAFK